VDALTYGKLTGFALRRNSNWQPAHPRHGEIDSLTEADAAFVPAKPKKTANKKEGANSD
jgi:hypothetical protein